MLCSIIASYLPYSFVTGFTPGPNNIVSLYAISQKGWRRGKDVLFGIAAGFFCVMVICALFCYELARLAPSVTGVLKYVGAAYIVYLAIHVALSKPGDSEQKQLTFISGFLLEFVNIKIILFAITVYTGYVLPYDPSLGHMLLHSVILTAVGVSGNLAWAVAGGLFQRFLAKYHRPLNLVMAVVLLWCAAVLLFDI